MTVAWRRTLPLTPFPNRKWNQTQKGNPFKASSVPPRVGHPEAGLRQRLRNGMDHAADLRYWRWDRSGFTALLFRRCFMLFSVLRAGLSLPVPGLLPMRSVITDWVVAQH